MPNLTILFSLTVERLKLHCSLKYFKCIKTVYKDDIGDYGKYVHV